MLLGGPIKHLSIFTCLIFRFLKNVFCPFHKLAVLKGTWVFMNGTVFIKQGNINIIPLTIISAGTKITVLMSTSLQVNVFLKGLGQHSNRPRKQTIFRRR